ncbi:uncharacterized protein LOC110701556 [Chenopodium quinoa]|uniref:uncharacterized protein LOC110701556 n=1 Tax=Chenopodium quinoa TaxID=63459 RepID=UPI000B778492|nr:uncharacterized protein LOC110701556 [Chenopodium quinoa]
MYTITSSILSRFPCLKDLCLDVCNLKLHSDFRFNKLVRLDLYYVVLEENQLQWMLSTSSTIEWLRIRWCNLPEKLCIGENLQRLSSLMIHDLSDLRETELNAKSLNFFDFVGRAIVKFSFLSNTKLKSSHVALIDKNYKGAECIIRDLATSIPSLETLLLEGPYSLLHLIPTHPSTLFRRVVRLSLIFKSEDPEVDMVKSFPRLLNSFWQLQKLYLMVPDTFLRRKYDLPGARYCSWIPWASYFLKSTVALDRMLNSRHLLPNTREGEWKRSAAHSFSQQECDYIRLALQGNAISPNADLVIQ